MSEAAIAKKAEIVKQTTDMLNAAQSAIVVDYRGLTVAEVTDLRKQLRDAGTHLYLTIPIIAISCKQVIC